MDRWLEKTAVVTGASEGIGAAIVRRLAKDGMKVAALARRRELLQALEHEAKETGFRGSVKGYICDVSSESQVAAVFKNVEDDLGPVHILVNNAALYRLMEPTDLNLDDAKAMIDTNLNGILHGLKYGTNAMKKHSINEGHIINISSISTHGSLPMPSLGVYAATKHALNVVSSSLRSQMKKDNSNIKVTTLSPGLVKTSMAAHLTRNLELGQYMLPEDVADVVSYLIQMPAHVNISELIVDNVAEFPCGNEN